METPHIVINWLTVVVAIIAAFVFGGLWYGPILGKVWRPSVWGVGAEPPQ